ncbi:MAG TPA: Gfo/Idh/MocA family oxidoreductase [Bacteroidales bacterium]|nr:Gfo/Idh/MocA family oxidoreductase [Bacteroidales bacterium]
MKAESQNTSNNPVSFAVARMNHDHIGFILGRVKNKNTAYRLAAIFEPDQKLVKKYSKIYNLDPSLFYDNLEKMLDKVKPEAVLAFGSTFDHLSVVEACAPRGIHVMVEKPLAVSMDHASKMKALADKYSIQLLTDYETSWYPSTAKAWQMVNDSSYVGKLRKVVVHDGHGGPVEIGCSAEFLSWLTDPVLNGGGALTDFGCYGANLMTYLTNGQKPISVTAVARQLKPSVYPKVDDDAVIIVSYPEGECIIQASWNWPFSRKDMEIYGDKGYVVADNNYDMRMRNVTGKVEVKRRITSSDIAVYEDPFSYFADVIRGRIKMKNSDPYSIENNMIVVRILDSARESAKKGAAVSF